MPKTTPTASIVVNQPSPKYGDFIDANVVASVIGTGVRFTFSQNGNIVGVSSTIFHNALAYTSEKCGLYSPIWTGGAADGLAEVIVSARKGYRTIASLAFEVTA